MCSPEAIGVRVTKEQGVAQVFSNGIERNVGAVSAYLSTGTDYNQQTKIDWTFVAAGQLCGNNATWPTAGRIVGK
jgi:hypothetical protein